MKRAFFYICLFLLSAMVFSQQNTAFNIVGRIPTADNTGYYQIQVGAFKVFDNAARVFQRLRAASLNPAYEQYQDFTRVVVRGIRAAEVPQYLDIIRSSGFPEVFIRIDTATQPPVSAPVTAPPVSMPITEQPVTAPPVSAPVSTPVIAPPVTAPVTAPPITAPPVTLPVSTAALPSEALSEIGYRSIKVGETRSLADLAANRTITAWTSSTPSTVRVDSNGNIAGQSIGNAFININAVEYISVVVVPQEEFFVVPESQAAMLPPESKAGEASTINLTEYRTEPTFRLAYRFANKGEYNGASGTNGGIDILGRGENYEWLWTTYEQGGWFYDLNDVKRDMINGFQKDAYNGVELTLKPEFIYDRGVPYLQLRHILHNPNNTAVSGQKFGASADVMIHRNDYASLMHTPYGAYMTDSATNPSLELILVCNSGYGIDPVDTLWLGTWGYGSHVEFIYDDDRDDIHNMDSAIGFSYQNIDLAPRETKEFIVRFTLARNED